MENLLRKAGILCVLVVLIALPLLTLPLSPANCLEESIERTFNSLSYDGYLYAEDNNYNIVRNQSTADSAYDDYMWWRIGQGWDDPPYYIHRAFLYFDTAVIPDDAIITSAKLKFRLYYNSTVIDFNITIQNGQPAHPLTPMETSDWDMTYYSGDGGQLNTTELVSGGYTEMNLTSTGLTWISKTTTTKLCLRSSRDIDGIAPTNTSEWEEASFYSSEKGVGYCPVLLVTYSVETFFYILQGSYNEMGIRNGAINVTHFPPQESPETFELDGVENKSAEQLGSIFTFDLGYNETRTYYTYQSYEDIFVFRPSDPYYNYYFSVVDYIGLEWGYLESIINVNGTDRVVERQTIEIVNDIPFMFSWGKSYKMRLVCNLGEYVFGYYVAGATTSFTLAISKDMFPETRTDIGDLTVYAARMNISWIQCVYYDANASTNWVNFALYEYGNTTAFLNYNTTAQSVNYNWYEAVSTIDYYVVVTVNHQTLGTKYWTFICAALEEGFGNPFGVLALLGDFPFDITQVPACLIVVIVMMAFSWWNAPIGIVASILVAFILAWIGWLAVGWAWLSLSGSMGFVLALAMRKDRERSI